MKTILLPFHDEDAGRTALDAATLVARRFGSYLEGLLVLEGPHLTFDRRMPVPANTWSRWSGNGASSPTRRARISC
jgi:hypothetical protein